LPPARPGATEQFDAVQIALPCVAAAQQKAMPVIGYLDVGRRDPGNTFQAAFRRGLSEASWASTGPISPLN
jgi:hypothetical protein